MSFETTIQAASIETGYPGDAATPDQILSLAEAFRLAADKLSETGLRGKPYRATIIHAIELYLNAILRARGLPHCEVRGLQHDLETRTLLLRLDKELGFTVNTRKHLAALTQLRAYVVARYGAEVVDPTPLTRLEATLREVGDKVSASLRQTATERT